MTDSTDFEIISYELKLDVLRLIAASEGRDGLRKSHDFEGELVRIVRLNSCAKEHFKTLRKYEAVVAKNPELNDNFIPVGIIRRAYKEMQKRVNKILDNYDRIAEASYTD